MKKLAFCSFLLYAATSFAQPGRAPQLESPVVNADRTVSFKFRAPKADSVLLSAQFLTSLCRLLFILHIRYGSMSSSNGVN